MTQTSTESELEQNRNNVGLKSASSAQADDHAEQTSATVSHNDSDEVEDDSGGVVEVPQIVVDVPAADVGLTNSMEMLVNDDDDDDQHVVTASLTEDDCCTAADYPPTQAVCDSHSEDLLQHEVLLSSDNSDDVSQISTPQVLSSAENNSDQSSQQQTVTVNGSTVHLACSEAADSVTRQPSSTRSAVVFSTVPRHVNKSSILSSSQPPVTSSSSSSSCTIMLTGSTTDVRSSPTAHRRTEAKQEGSQIEVSAAARRASPDAMSYTSTIIRCSTSSAPVIATSNAKSRDTGAPAAVVDNLEASPPATPHIKKTPNYVSVVQIGSSASATSPSLNERRVIPVTATTTSADSITIASLFASQNSLLQTSRQHATMSDSASCTPIKSSLKKLTPTHTKTKSVSFSTGSGDDNDDIMSVTATTTEISNVQQPDTNRAGLAEAIVHVNGDNVDSIAPRRAMVSDSGVFCELEDDQTPLTSNDNKATATQPSRRTTVIVGGAGGMTSTKNNPRHHQRDKLANLAGSELHSESRDIIRPSNPSSRRRQQVSAPRSSASTYVTDKIIDTKQNPTPDTRRKKSDNTIQASCGCVIYQFLTVSELLTFSAKTSLSNLLYRVAH